MNLIVPREIEDFGKFSTELGLVLDVIKASNSEAEMGKVIEGNPKYESVKNEVVDSDSNIKRLGKLLDQYVPEEVNK